MMAVTMSVTVDSEAGACYLSLSHIREVARTREITDLVLVDENAAGEAIGVEFIVTPERITADMIEAVVQAYPYLAPLRNMIDERPLQDGEIWLDLDERPKIRDRHHHR